MLPLVRTGSRLRKWQAEGADSGCDAGAPTSGV